MNTYIVTGTFHSVTEMVEHLQSEVPITVIAYPNIKPGQLLVGNWNPNFEEWEDVKEATADEVMAALIPGDTK